MLKYCIYDYFKRNNKKHPLSDENLTYHPTKLLNNNQINYSSRYHAYIFHQSPSELALEKGFTDINDLISKARTDRNKFNPIIATYYGLLLWNQFERNQFEQDSRDFIKIVSLLKEIGETKNERFILYYYFDYPRFGIQAPWHSGITQGQALSCFIRYYLYNPSDQAADYCHRLYKSLVYPIKKGGLLSSKNNVPTWIEEYPQSKSPFVLNGFLFSLVALFEYVYHFPNHCDIGMIRQLCSSFFERYHTFVRGKDIKYSSARIVLGNIQYQGLHVFQMFHLYQLTGVEGFRQSGQYFIKNVNWKLFASFHKIEYENLIKELQMLWGRN